ncbi:hypothetical protein [Mammaliicoccus sp. H-M34]|uniref:hypothetical protein n=1 Tax=Mammaliicoccus sp. H-M34 TaxID=2898693 RepID=UPI001EFB2C37|nr:hypothetical protein [Mammaliicoccus sp. H-M34]
MHIDELEHKCIKSTKDFTQGELYDLIPTEIRIDENVYKWFSHELGVLFDDEFKKEHFDQIHLKKENRIIEFD